MATFSSNITIDSGVGFYVSAAIGAQTITIPANTYYVVTLLNANIIQINGGPVSGVSPSGPMYWGPGSVVVIQSNGSQWGFIGTAFVNSL